METVTSTVNRAQTDVALTAFRLEIAEGWQDRVMAAATAGGAGTSRRGAGCIVWNPKSIKVWRGGLRYAEAVFVARQWFGPELTALAFLPRRVYFEKGADIPSRKSEFALLGDARPSLLPPATRIRMCLDYARWLQKRLPGLAETPLAISRSRTGLHRKTRLVFGGSNRAVAGEKISTLLMRHGAHTVPRGMKVDIIAEDTGNPKVAAYSQLLVDAFAKSRCEVAITIRSYDGVDQLVRRGTFACPGQCMLVAVTGRKGQPLTPTAVHVLDTLEANGVPFRMFSIDNPALRWSALDQVGSLLMGAGGVPYVLELPWPANVRVPYLLGVDLGHPKTRQASWVVMSLSDSRGTLIESWRQRQALDETVRPEVLRAGLAWARQAARKHAREDNPGFLVIRDGRLHTGESVNTYRRILGDELTFVELAKYENPEMFKPADPPAPVQAGTECLPEGGVTPLIVPVSPRLGGDLARTLKLHMPPEWDGLRLGIDTVSEILVGLSYTPGLGLATHALPGPIYWADGIAAIGDMNNQFAGQEIVSHGLPRSKKRAQTGICGQ